MAVPFPTLIPPKNPLSTIDYEFDWSLWLAEGETITSASVTAQDGITIAIPASVNGGVVVFWLSGGTAGSSYLISCQVTTSMPNNGTGRTDARSFTLSVK